MEYLLRCLNVLIIIIALSDMIFLIFWPTATINWKHDPDSRRLSEKINKIWTINVTALILAIFIFCVVEIVSYVITGAPILSEGNAR